jgi:hypothetical protein
MANKHLFYGNYYGELLSIENIINRIDEDEEDEFIEFSFNDLRSSEIEDMIKNLKSYGVVEVLFDVEKLNDHSDTMFFKTDENTDYKKLMIYLIEFRPDEFSEESNNHFRLWFD